MVRAYYIPSKRILEKSKKKTSIGRRNIGTSTMNKHKRRMKNLKYRGQGK